MFTLSCDESFMLLMSPYACIPTLIRVIESKKQGLISVAEIDDTDRLCKSIGCHGNAVNLAPSATVALRGKVRTRQCSFQHFAGSWWQYRRCWQCECHCFFACLQPRPLRLAARFLVQGPCMNAILECKCYRQFEKRVLGRRLWSGNCCVVMIYCASGGNFQAFYFKTISNYYGGKVRVW